MPTPALGSWAGGPVAAPGSKRTTTIWSQAREEFLRWSCDVFTPITVEDVALRLKRLLEEDGVAELTCTDRQAIALRAAEMVQAMDLKRSGSVDIDEWMHWLVYSKTGIASLQESPTNRVLQDILRKEPKILEDLLKTFQTADMKGRGYISLVEMTDMYRRGKWKFQQKGDEFPPSTDPAVLARRAFEAMDFDNSGSVSYAEFIAYCMGRRKQKVIINFYDLSEGLASKLAPWLLGAPLEGLWHTGVVVFGKEYYFGGDIFHDTPADTAFGTPHKSLEWGVTLRTQQELHKFIVKELQPLFNRNVYDIIHRNCNHFSDRVCAFLTGKNMPNEVVQQPEYLSQLPAARFLRPVLNRCLGAINGGDVFSADEEQKVRFCDLPDILPVWGGCCGLPRGSIVNVEPDSNSGLPAFRGVVCEAPACSPGSSRRSGRSARSSRDTWVRVLGLTGAELRDPRIQTKKVLHESVSLLNFEAQEDKLYLAALDAVSTPSACSSPRGGNRQTPASPSGGGRASFGLNSPKKVILPGAMSASLGAPLAPHIALALATAGDICQLLDDYEDLSPRSISITAGVACMQPAAQAADQGHARIAGDEAVVYGHAQVAGDEDSVIATSASTASSRRGSEQVVRTSAACTASCAIEDPLLDDMDLFVVPAEEQPLVAPRSCEPVRAGGGSSRPCTAASSFSRSPRTVATFARLVPAESDMDTSGHLAEDWL